MIWFALAGMASSVIGKEQGREATVEGAKTQAEIERLSRDAQKARFKRDIEYQKPFMEAGEKAVPEYAKAVKNEFDVTQSPLYRMQKDMIMGEIKDAPDFVKQNAMEALGAREGELAKGRLLDIQQIGLGMAGSAGRTAINFGTAYAGSLQRGQGALAQGQLSGAMQQQNIWTSALENLSGYPAYAYQQRALSGPSQPAQQTSVFGGTTAAPQSPGMLGGASQYTIR